VLEIYTHFAAYCLFVTHQCLYTCFQLRILYYECPICVGPSVLNVRALVFRLCFANNLFKSFTLELFCHLNCVLLIVHLFLKIWLDNCFAAYCLFVAHQCLYTFLQLRILYIECPICVGPSVLNVRTLVFNLCFANNLFKSFTLELFCHVNCVLLIVLLFLKSWLDNC
jgi:hypothetical protein